MIISPAMTLEEQAILVSLLSQASHEAWKVVDKTPKSKGKGKEYDMRYDFAWDLQNVFLSIMDELLRLGVRKPCEDVKMFIIRAGINESV
jgi:hypothetical protein